MSAPDRPISIHVEDEPADETRAIVLAGLRRFNRQNAEPPDFLPLTLAARTGDGKVVGGLVGETAWKWLHVDLLWVDEPHRGRGLGRRLLRLAEQEAERRGCGHVHLDTFDFQALPFYEREGYGIFGIQEDYPPGHRRYFLRKALDDSGARDVDTPMAARV
ncbi:MAG TPA: GNAT family N-acetyltransferase [Gemmatimonadaceae bacterium]|nr:GNAT family N-acetyltransferase [Gemmatimonadaceae bacterium]